MIEVLLQIRDGDEDYLTKFCPVYFILNKLMLNTEPIQNGK